MTYSAVLTTREFQMITKTILITQKNIFNTKELLQILFNFLNRFN